FFDLQLVDRVYWFTAPVILGSTKSPAAVRGTGAALLAKASWLRSFRMEQIGNSWLVQGSLSSWARD
ncbi:MAG: riboflavin biosynthesis protein RibD, partial [Acidobacteria bacterium]|nr:riboflavin biosynthesis protein RibD [Acidobacteriota bacterium]